MNTSTPIPSTLCVINLDFPTTKTALEGVKYASEIVHSFSGKELDAETGYSYFGARYYDPTTLAAWLSVDPMSDKYPSISPYAYCAWNPLKLVDPDGEEMFPTEAEATKVRSNAIELFGELRVGDIFNKGDDEHPDYAFHVFGYGKDKYEKPIPNESGVWAYKPDKCIDSKFDLFMYSTFKAKKEWSLNASITLGAEAKIQLGSIGAGVNLSDVDLVGIDWDLGKGQVDTYRIEDNNAGGSRGVYLGVFTLAGQNYKGGDYIDQNSLQTNVLGAGIGKNEGRWNLSIGAALGFGIHINFNSKIKK